MINEVFNDLINHKYVTCSGCVLCTMFIEMVAWWSLSNEKIRNSKI